MTRSLRLDAVMAVATSTHGRHPYARRLPDETQMLANVGERSPRRAQRSTVDAQPIKVSTAAR